MVYRRLDFSSNLFLFSYYLLESEEINMEMLKVSSKSNPNSVAGAIANIFREKGNEKIRIS